MDFKLATVSGGPPEYKESDHRQELNRALQRERIEVLSPVKITAADLLQVPKGTITEGGLHTNLSLGVQYPEAWLRGTGCVPLYHLIEDGPPRRFPGPRSGSGFGTEREWTMGGRLRCTLARGC